MPFSAGSAGGNGPLARKRKCSCSRQVMALRGDVCSFGEQPERSAVRGRGLSLKRKTGVAYLLLSYVNGRVPFAATKGAL